MKDSFRFPTNIQFRLLYVFFLMERMKNKQQSLQELNEIEELNPTFHYQIILFRYKLKKTKSFFFIYHLLRKLIEDDLAKIQNDGLDDINDITSKKRYKEIKKNIEKIIILNMEFWSQLSEERPGKIIYIYLFKEKIFF